MSRKLPKIDRARVKTTSARRRHSKVSLDDEAVPHRPGASFADFLEGLPGTLGAAEGPPKPLGGAAAAPSAR